MSEKIEKIDIKEFREFGFLQELNRQFLHPLGLALEIEIDDSGKESLSGIWDYRDDIDGLQYSIKGSDVKRKRAFRQKYENVRKLLLSKIPGRSKLLGFLIEPLPSEESLCVEENNFNDENKVQYPTWVAFPKNTPTVGVSYSITFLDGKGNSHLGCGTYGEDGSWWPHHIFSEKKIIAFKSENVPYIEVVDEVK